MKRLHIIICALGLFTFISACKKEDNPEPENKGTAVAPSGHFYTKLVDGIIVDEDTATGRIDTILAVKGGDIMVMVHTDPSKPTQRVRAWMQA